MQGSELTRRQALRIGGGAAAAGLVTSLAGCSGLLGGGSSASYAEWLHEPGTFSDDTDHYTVTYIDATAYVDNEDEFDEDSFENIESAVESSSNIVDLDFDEVEEWISTGAGTVLTGSFDTEDLSDELEDNDYDDDTEYEGYTIFLSSDEQSAVGVSGDTVIVRQAGFRSEDPEPVDDIEMMIDVSNGDEDRYADDSEAMDEAISELGDGAQVFAGTQEEAEETFEADGTFEGQVASGNALQINGDTADVKAVRVFDSEDDVDTGDLEDWTEESDGSFEDVDDIDVSQSGRLGIVTGVIDTDDL